MRFAILALTFLALPLFAQDASKQKPIDFTAPLTGFDGKPIQNLVDGTKEPELLTLGEEAAVALNTPLQSDQEETQAHKNMRGKLISRILGCKACVLSDGEKQLILQRAGQMPNFPAFIFSQMTKILDPVAWEKADL